MNMCCFHVALVKRRKSHYFMVRTPNQDKLSPSYNFISLDVVVDFLASISSTMHCILLFMNDAVASFIIMLADYGVMVSTLQFSPLYH